MAGARANTPLTRLLDSRGIRYSWLAAQLGVRPWTFSRIEGGVQTPPPSWYARAAVVLGVAIQDIEPAGITPREEVAA